jgi:hypothetical protein
VWAAEPATGIWEERSEGLPAGPVQALSLDANGAVWTAVNDQLFTWVRPAWRSVGARLPETGTEIRAIAGGPRLIVSTHRGVYASTDQGVTWDATADNLPGHLEAGPLVTDPTDPATLYVGFALTPYDEQWRRVLEGTSGAGRLALVDLAGGAAFLALLGLVGGGALHWLARRDSA